MWLKYLEFNFRLVVFKVGPWTSRSSSLSTWELVRIKGSGPPQPNGIRKGGLGPEHWFVANLQVSLGCASVGESLLSTVRPPFVSFAAATTDWLAYHCLRSAALIPRLRGASAHEEPLHSNCCARVYFCFQTLRSCPGHFRPRYPVPLPACSGPLLGLLRITWVSC